MNVLTIPELSSINKLSSISQVSAEMDLQQKYRVGISPWPEFKYKPDVDFAIAHSNEHLLLKFYVTEKHVRAINLMPNGPVYNDSCVEFFISWGEDKTYYNLEFNCSGTCNFGYGEIRDRRTPICESLIKRVLYQSVFKSLNMQEPSLIHWELTLKIPVEVFAHHQFASFNDRSCRVNFYKCGDLLPQPHYLSWTEIHSAEPNFHLPEFFGKAFFAGEKSEINAKELIK